MIKEAEQYLNNIPMWASKKNSLKAVRDFLSELGNPDEAAKIIHVAGTNGKGSVCSYLTSILTKAGYKVKTFISPHLVTTKERFMTDGEPVDDETFCQAFRRVKDLSDTMTARGYGPPTYFEFLFYMFMEMCSREKPDYIVLETGLGGILDTTNAVSRPVLAVITSISMDHMQYLGDTIEKISLQKAGIIKPGAPLVYDGANPESSRIFQARAKELGCRACPVSRKNYTLRKRGETYTDLTVRTGTGSLDIRIPSIADYQMANSALAVTAAVMLLETNAAGAVRPEHIKKGIEESFWPGRMEEVLPRVYLDGAHNQGGMEALARTIERMQQETKRPVSLMFGVASDKEYPKMIEELCSRLDISHVTIVHMHTERSAGEGELAREFQERLKCSVESFATVDEGWNHFLDTKGEGLAFCAGSLYLVGEVKEILARKS